MLYSFLFLINKYFRFNLFEHLLNLYEDRYIKKYISKKEVRAQQIPTINAPELTQEIFEQLSDNYRRPVLIKGYLKDTNAAKSWTENYGVNMFFVSSEHNFIRNKANEIALQVKANPEK